LEGDVTYSIVARDPATGAMGIGVQSAYFAAGGVVPWAEAGVGAVATQSVVDIGYGPRGLALMRDGASASEALAALVAADEMEALRQVAMVDATGAVAVHTGVGCVAHAGHRVGDGVSVQANMMLTGAVPDAMLDAFDRSTGDLALRLLTAMDAAQAQGGDARGQQAAGILVVDGDRSEEPWNHVLVSLRVDDSGQPLEDLRRLATVGAAAGAMARTFPLLFAPSFDGSRDELEAALTTLADAQRAYGDTNMQPTFWRAVLLAKDGRIDEAQPLVAACIATNSGWRDYVLSVRDAGILPADPPDVADRLIS
jgi:uncharacterized Ntn-hydrolase superfamily protein